MTININTPDTGLSEPLFPAGELCSFVERYVNRRSEFLRLTENQPPPLYVLEPSVLRERAKQFQDAFLAHLPDAGFYYAVKSNNHPAVAAELVKSGMGLDVSSGLELAMALETGAMDIVFSGPGKTDGELRQAVAHSERVTLLVDSFGELDRLGRITGALGTTMRIGVRLNTNPKGLWRKFGILPEQLGEFMAEADKTANIEFRGLQFHTSWNLSPAAHVEFIRSLGQVLSGLPRAALERIRFIDIGGGFWPSQGEWLQPASTSAGKLKISQGLPAGSPLEHYRLPAAGIDEFAREIGRAVREHIFSSLSCRICAEPGRWLCNDAMHLLLSVVDRKGGDLVITDAGANTVGWERYEHDYFPVINLSRPALKERPCNVLGSLCTPHDVWGWSYWGEDIRIGDILLIPTQGAYTYSLRQNFIKPLPTVATL